MPRIMMTHTTTPEVKMASYLSSRRGRRHFSFMIGKAR